MREIVFDTETTGFSPHSGDRVVEVGCIELVDRRPTGETFHEYVNPERDMPAGAYKVHKLSAEFLSDKPKFGEISTSLMAFFGSAHLVAHNASFDVGFLNAELALCHAGSLDSFSVVDTLALARLKFPGMPNKLDDLCRRFHINLERRSSHGALIDAELLSEVYIELLGGRQGTFSLSDHTSEGCGTDQDVSEREGDTSYTLEEFRLSQVQKADREELSAHARLVRILGNEAVWLRYPTPT